ncbi:Uncharacterised protein [Yersinia intermedia]|jgi:hypothetical protein|uniref:Uncharacterized protein n=1 Tax=Yersinia intermedia TaxID=631 RepID=A0A0T9LZ62_YERIN|nr:Uncharacterised protein [Yersinia intermedia]CNF40124.1 Uncharacterised protein [Yersinia intermedia]CNI10087.1 Uncharacterised protein [Yersinia intermedia]
MEAVRKGQRGVGEIVRLQEQKTRQRGRVSQGKIS